MIKNDSLENIIKEINQLSNVVVTSHLGPDGDSIGATLSMGLVLEKMAKKVTFLISDAIPAIYQFLPGAHKVVQKLPKSHEYDGVVLLDVFDVQRSSLNSFPRKKMGKVIILDHHLTQEKHGDFQHIDPEAAASGVLVYRFAKKVGIPITEDIAQNIYCCILTDTGSFRYSSANPEAFQIAGEMVQCGAKPWELSKNIYESFPPKRFKLLAEVLKSLEISKDGKCALISIGQELLNKFDNEDDLTDGFINFPRSIKGVEVAIFLRQTGNNHFKASFRSGGSVDVRAICQKLGGGGHRNAAGCNLKGNEKELKEKILSITHEFISEVTP